MGVATLINQNIQNTFKFKFCARLNYLFISVISTNRLPESYTTDKIIKTKIRRSDCASPSLTVLALLPVYHAYRKRQIYTSASDNDEDGVILSLLRMIHC